MKPGGKAKTDILYPLVEEDAILDGEYKKLINAVEKGRITAYQAVRSLMIIIDQQGRRIEAHRRHKNLLAIALVIVGVANIVAIVK